MRRKAEHDERWELCTFLFHTHARCVGGRRSATAFRGGTAEDSRRGSCRYVLTEVTLACNKLPYKGRALPCFFHEIAGLLWVRAACVCVYVCVRACLCACCLCVFAACSSAARFLLAVWWLGSKKLVMPSRMCPWGPLACKALPALFRSSLFTHNIIIST